MFWTLDGYFKNVYLAHNLKLVGWPEELIWRNLSYITSFKRISFLVKLWNEGDLRFEPVSPIERQAALLDYRKAAPAPRYFTAPPKLGRSDLKARKHRPKKNPLGLPGRYVRKGPKSAKWVTAAAERRAEMATVAEA